MIRRVLLVLAVLAATPLLLTVAYTVVSPVSTLMLARTLTGARVERIWTPIADISPVAVRTVIASEDARFCRHPGIDLAEMRAAIDKADDLGDVRGASTITMQLAKNLFLWPGRDFIRKAIEMPLALWLDLVLSKRRQMEIYLNIAEWGPDGEFGIAAGARRAFGRPPSALDAHQSALLAVMLPNPRRRDAARPGPGLGRRAARLEARVPKEGTELTACLRL